MLIAHKNALKLQTYSVLLTLIQFKPNLGKKSLKIFKVSRSPLDFNVFFTKFFNLLTDFFFQYFNRILWKIREKLGIFFFFFKFFFITSIRAFCSTFTSWSLSQNLFVHGTCLSSDIT